MILAFLFKLFIKGVLLVENVLLILLIVTFWSFFFSTKNILTLVIHSEFAIVVLFFLMLVAGVYSAVNLLFGLAYLVLILGALELALNILLLLL